VFICPKKGQKTPEIRRAEEGGGILATSCARVDQNLGNEPKGRTSNEGSSSEGKSKATAPECRGGFMTEVTRGELKDRSEKTRKVGLPDGASAK